MPSHVFAGRDADVEEQQLPFTGDSVHDADFSDQQGAQTVPRSRTSRAYSIASQSLSTSYTRNPVRSFAHQTSHGFGENPHYASQGVRERSSQLASYALDTETYQDRPPRHSFAEADGASGRHAGLLAEYQEGRSSPDSAAWTDTIDEDSEAETPNTVIGPDYSTLGSQHAQATPHVVVQDADERTPLLPVPRLSRLDSQPKQTPPQKEPPTPRQPISARLGQAYASSRQHITGLQRSLTNPKNFTTEAVLSRTLMGVQTLSAVFLGLLLNILDALSYGYILFPLGSPIFSQTGPDGISIFFVSCIVAQLCYSLGLSTFRGGIGSEMIEVVPFFHKMAYSIMAQMEGEPAEAVIATTIVSYCLSSILTGLIFLALGYFKLGKLVSFFPRHILIGCIGGVGFFLVVTGFEVSARLEGSLNYDLDTLHKLFSSDTWYLWALPLLLAISIIILQRLVKSPFVLPAFFVLIFATFYIIVKGILHKDLQGVRNAGWIFEQPEAGVQFYRFYSYFSTSRPQIVKYEC